MQCFRLSRHSLAYLFSLCAILFLVGCVQYRGAFVSKNHVILAEQNPNSHFEQEVMIVRISQVLLVGKMSNEERASLHFERGVLYDSLGLWGLARYDFTQALALQPKMAAVYNYLGLYLLLEEDYDGALETFNAVFELDPSYDYTHLNRGLNFYYVGRYNLAEQDFLQFYQADTTDPYRVLWLYLNEQKLKPQEAHKNLVERAKGLSKDFWGTNIVQYYLGHISLEELQQRAGEFAGNSQQYAEILTETYFYLAKQKLNVGLVDEAAALFKLAMANQVYNFVEYRFASFELMKLKPAQTQQEKEVKSAVTKTENF
ncbi:lipoprotein NlpI [Rodentibacter pneumotropicus]|uniref:Lipoprotein NlpI n=1 Tax=Rodentibacter pneumotropicus TaxID=758 RepID=A0A4S2PHH2_9PAST|nr:lipoprotein NlpI [Rodentibacter pneumotropicus]NBH75113.1 lipoprotein NlpI [Rodentibacter pneumotropicus]OOF60679.1 lipoprotein NlpI-like protein [Rodentibacter pneumotropicus]THA02709.1 lipoprotein NlpI [Rodentibacter pneumotropicus]THA05170.1 lipoprotein NlpI [Rodentibacter pneumotropicus]THA10037.1 lipoprotein NlpI [Rodentibacter pneumotropicus]